MYYILIIDYYFLDNLLPHTRFVMLEYMLSDMRQRRGPSLYIARDKAMLVPS